MKGLVVLILAMVTIITAEETEYTRHGKKVILNEDFTWSYIVSNTSDNVFRSNF